MKPTMTIGGIVPNWGAVLRNLRGTFHVVSPGGTVDEVDCAASITGVTFAGLAADLGYAVNPAGYQIFRISSEPLGLATIQGTP